jgi:hypothetical protein
MEKKMRLSSRWWWVIIGLVVIGTLGLIALRSWSAVGSSLATPMRKVLGVERVAQMETVLFNIQDRYTQIKFQLGIAEAASPWQSSEALIDPPATPHTEPILATATEMIATATPEAGDIVDGAEILQDRPSTPTPTVDVTPTAMDNSWKLPDIQPLGSVEQEGKWQPYLYHPDGDVAAYRTFLQPDPERPYTIVAVAAFDLEKTNLHFVLGKEEPSKPGGPRGYGVIPAEDFQPDRLLAVFNGGFIAEHGGYGAMANGVTALAGKAGLATIGIFKDGAVRIGEWKNDLPQDGDYQSWRQNAIMIIHNGEINPKVETGSYIEWGANLDGSVVTMRSAVGLSEDNRVLYYFAGPKLSMPVLAKAMAAAGVHNGMLLDINPTHAHFTAMRLENGEWKPEPLYKEEMNVWVDRYLRPWKQDFFYVTAK